MKSYTYTIYDQETGEVVDHVTVTAENWLPGADDQIDDWLEQHPGMCVNPNGPECIVPISEA
jgi:hypothetical protein